MLHSSETSPIAFWLVGSIPEPGSLLLIAAGLAVLWWAWKRRR